MGSLCNNIVGPLNFCLHSGSLPKLPTLHWAASATSCAVSAGTSKAQTADPHGGARSSLHCMGTSAVERTPTANLLMFLPTEHTACRFCSFGCSTKPDPKLSQRCISRLPGPCTKRWLPGGGMQALQRAAQGWPALHACPRLHPTSLCARHQGWRPCKGGFAF